MATAPYNVQQLAVAAYGWINATGATAAGFGCSMTRLSTGLYRLRLGPSDGILEGQSWIVASVVQNASSAGRYVTPCFVSNVIRDFAVNADDGGGGRGDAGIDCDLEVVVYKTSVNVTGI